jgi:hypothetical protein
MAEAYAALNSRSGGKLEPLHEQTMFHAAEVLAATLLEDSAICEDESAFESASVTVTSDILEFLEVLRSQREETGVSALSTIVEQAGLVSHRIQ